MTLQYEPKFFRWDALIISENGHQAVIYPDITREAYDWVRLEAPTPIIEFYKKIYDNWDEIQQTYKEERLKHKL